MKKYTFLQNNFITLKRSGQKGKDYIDKLKQIPGLFHEFKEWIDGETNQDIQELKPCTREIKYTINSKEKI